jgi:hypothetical protein
LKTPTPEAVDGALARLGKPGANAYFFDNLKNPHWIHPLYKRGFFKRPPAAERDPAERTISFPDWPELRYLLRMAPDAPADVGEIVVAIPETDNARIRQIMIQIGLLLPREASKQLGGRAIGWLEEPIVRLNFGEAFAQFIAHLARLGEIKTALAMATRLFLVDRESNGTRSRDALDAWHVERFLKQCVPSLLETAGLRTLEFLRDRLYAATKPTSPATGDDYSYIWRSDILHAKYASKEVSDVFVDAVRDSALTLARDKNVGPENVFSALLAIDRPILKRIAMYIASMVADACDPIVMRFLLDRSLVDRLTCRAEYSMLLQATFEKLPAKDRKRIEECLTTNLLESIPEDTQKELSSEKLGRFAKHTQRDRLLAFGPVLPAPLVPTLTRLTEEEGPPISYQSTVTPFEPASPVSRDDLLAMPVTEIVRFIDQWEPSSGFREANAQGLGQSLHAIAKARANEFAEQARLWINREAIYIRWVVMGVSDAVALNARIEQWPPLLDLAKWIIVQADPPPPTTRDPWRGLDSGWIGARQSIIRLLNNGLVHKESGLPFECRSDVWSILERLLNDTDPKVSEVDESTIDNDSLAQSINCVRGEATHALFRYLWWVHEKSAQADQPASLDRMPEVRAALGRTVRDPAPAIRSVLGDWLRTILFFDFSWASAHIDDIFPESDASMPFWLASWGTFVKYSLPYDPAFDLLESKYELAILRLRSSSDEERKSMGELGLGHHLASYFWRAIGGERSHELLLRYFDDCSPAAAGQIAASLGQGLRRTAAPVSGDTIASLMRLWGELRDRGAGWGEQKQREVLRQFGRWFASGRFPNDWSLKGLNECLLTGAGLVDLEEVLVQLESLAASEPREVATCLGLLLKDDRQLWHPMAWQREVERVLEALLRSKDNEGRKDAELIVNRLVEGGSLFARDILSRINAPRQDSP